MRFSPNRMIARGLKIQYYHLTVVVGILCVNLLKVVISVKAYIKNLLFEWLHLQLIHFLTSNQLYPQKRSVNFLVYCKVTRTLIKTLKIKTNATG